MNKFKLKGTVIYHLISDDKVVYVGKTTSIINRLNSHYCQNLKVYDSVEFFDVDSSVVDLTEYAEILKHQPKYNKVLPVFNYLLYKTEVQKIRKALSPGNVNRKGYDLDNSDSKVSLNGVTFEVWMKTGKEIEFNSFKKFIGDYR